MAMPPISSFASFTAFLRSCAMSASAFCFRAAACARASPTISSPRAVAVFWARATIWLASARAFCRFCSYSAFMASASVRSFCASAIWLSALALRSAITFLTGFSRNFLKMSSWIIRLQIWARKVQPSSVINAWYSSISVSFRSFVKGSAYARNFINMPGARKISSRPVTKP